MMISYFRLKTIRYSTCLSAYRRKKIYTCQTSLSGVTMNIGSSSRFEHQEEEKDIHVPDSIVWCHDEYRLVESI